MSKTERYEPLTEEKIDIDYDYMRNNCKTKLDISEWSNQSNISICGIPGDNGVMQNVRKHGNHEKKNQINLFKRVFHEFPQAVFIDAGANIGVYTVSAAVLGRTVFAFEPVREYFKALSHSVAVNKLSKKVHLYNYALMEKESDSE